VVSMGLIVVLVRSVEYSITFLHYSMDLVTFALAFERVSCPGKLY
jgi:hypothetical protein